MLVCVFQLTQQLYNDDHMSVLQLVLLPASDPLQKNLMLIVIDYLRLI